MAIRRDYVTLNAMRGVAALGVMLFHGVGLFGAIMPRGYLAVDLFFVLSGFVIAHAYEAKLTGGLGRRAFVRVRLIRFYPLYAAGLLVGLLKEGLLIATHNGYAFSPLGLLAALIAGALFLPMPLAQRGYNLFPINIPSWSLFFELLVNILYAVVLPWLTTRTLLVTIAISAVLLVVLAPAGGIGDVGVTSLTFAGGCVRTILSFSIGLLIHRLQPRMPRVPTLALLVATAAALACPWGGLAYDLGFVFVISPLLVLLGISTEPSAALARPAAMLGILSFPIYALHRPVVALAEAVAAKAHLPGPVVGVPVLLVLVVLCCTLAPAFDLRARAAIGRIAGLRLWRDKAEAAAP
jgi:peptidoglycan/LPS O-acetylase OafA/YrhL